MAHRVFLSLLWHLLPSLKAREVLRLQPPYLGLPSDAWSTQTSCSLRLDRVAVLTTNLAGRPNHDIAGDCRVCQQFAALTFVSTEMRGETERPSATASGRVFRWSMF